MQQDRCTTPTQKIYREHKRAARDEGNRGAHDRALDVSKIPTLAAKGAARMGHPGILSLLLHFFFFFFFGELRAFTVQ